MNQPDEQALELDVTPGKSDGTGDRPEITMAPNVVAQIKCFAGTDTSRELAGVLLGRVDGAASPPHVEVLAAIEAKHTNAGRASVTFTHETWDDINRTRDEEYPDLRVVGWFHTHPGFGIFLSGRDLFIHHHFFNLPWQIAYVVDPVTHNSGFFRWADGEVERVRQQAGEAETGDEEAEIPSHSAVASGRSVNRTAQVGAGIALGVAVGAVAVQPLFQPAPQRTPDLPRQQIAKNPQPAVASEAKYKVQPGDTLSEISQSHYGDVGYVGEIQQRNPIVDPDLILAGETIILPVITQTGSPRRKGPAARVTKP